MNKESSTDKLNCSFCGKVQDEVKKLIAGPSVYICYECVDLCNDFIEEEILYREALRLGLDQNDRIIKRRLAQKISFLKQETNRAEPDTEQLTDFFEMNLDL